MTSQKNEKIFVSIASYRDPQIQKTIDSCIDNADSKDDLRIVVCDQWGNSPEEVRPQPQDNVEIIRVNHRSSLGCCWARGIIQKRHKDEQYYLQIDAHSRFKAGWDTFYKSSLNSLKESGVDKPVLSSALPAFDYDKNKNYNGFVSKRNTILTTGSFLEESLAITKYAVYSDSECPVRMPWLQAGFIFSYGSMVKEIPYNQKLFFNGEEDDLSIRLFTNGYDIYSTTSNLIGHDYSKRNRYWDDFTGTGPKGWWKLEHQSRDQLKKLTENKIIGNCSLGNKRPLKEFEEFAKINYERKEILQSKNEHENYLRERCDCHERKPLCR